MHVVVAISSSPYAYAMPILHIVPRHFRLPRRLTTAITLVICAIVLCAASLLALTRAGFDHQQANACPSGSAHTADAVAIASCSGRWVPTTLKGEVYALLQTAPPSVSLYAGTTSGLRASTDGGRSWSAEQGGLGKMSILALAATSDRRTVYAGTDRGAIYQRLPGGATAWRLIGSPTKGSAIFDLSVAPGDARTVLAGTIGGIYRGMAQDGTWTWDRVVSTGDSSVTSIAWAPWDRRTAFASVFGTSPAVLTSSDVGRSWTASTLGLPSTLPSETLLAIPASNSMMLSTMGAGVWLMTSGSAWRDVSAGLPEHHAMPITGDGSVQFAGTMGYGIFARQDDSSWRRLGKELADGEHIVLSVLLTRGPSQVLLAGTANGLFSYQLTGN
jgi:photosystem II stability/assembly factor-like uncharacterized protein